MASKAIVSNKELTKWVSGIRDETSRDSAFELLIRLRGTYERHLAERSEWTPVAYPGDEIDQKFVFEKMEEIYSTYKRNGHRDTLAVCRRKQREDAVPGVVEATPTVPLEVREAIRRLAAYGIPVGCTNADWNRWQKTVDLWLHAQGKD